MILREWKGIAKAAEADHFTQHLKTVTFPDVLKIQGFVRGTVTRRDAESACLRLKISERGRIRTCSQWLKST